MPKNTSVGFFIAVFSFVLGFGLVWHMIWLAALSLLAIILCILVRSFDEEIDYYIPKEEVMRIESRRHAH